MENKIGEKNKLSERKYILKNRGHLMNKKKMKTRKVEAQEWILRFSMSLRKQWRRRNSEDDDDFKIIF